MILSNHAILKHADLWDRIKTMSFYGDRRWKIAKFLGHFQWIKSLYSESQNILTKVTPLTITVLPSLFKGL